MFLPYFRAHFSELKGLSGKVGHIQIGVVGHLLQYLLRRALQTRRGVVVKGVLGRSLLQPHDDLRHAELDVRDVVLQHGLEVRHYQFLHLVCGQQVHCLTEGLETADAVVVALLVGVQLVLDGWDELLDDPLGTEGLAERAG